MDSADLALFGALARKRLAWWANSDPRASARMLADQLGVDRSTVSARLRRWIDRGFLVERHFIPNPGLFGEAFGAALVTLDSALEKTAFMDAFADAEGAVAALDATGQELVVVMAHDGPATLERHLRNLRRMPAVQAVGPWRPFPMPPPLHRPTALGWRLLRALREKPVEGGVEALAAALGASSRTLRRHHQLLLEGNAALCITIFDFTRAGPGAPTALLLGLDGNADRAHVTGALPAALPPFVEYPSARASVWDHPGSVLQLLVPLESVGAVEDLQRRALAVPGVSAVHASFPHRLRFVTPWVDGRLRIADAPRA